MKKIICIGLISFLLTSSKSFSQAVDLSTDSVEALLCKKWEVNYALMGERKIGRIPGATEINYEFKKDKTFLMTSNDPKDNTKGTWAYDAKKKIIKLTINGRNNNNIISLKDEELIMLANMNEGSAGDPMELKIVYKIKAK
jgi:hypothetical protein